MSKKMRMLKNSKKRFIAGIMAFVMTTSVCSVSGVILKNNDTIVKAGTPVVNDDGKYNANLKSDKKSRLGSKDNPFVVLEVVPNVSMASFGYMVQGQEPVDVTALSKSEDAGIAEDMGSYIEFDDSKNVEKKEYENFLTDEEKSGMKLLHAANQYGEYKYEGNGKGEYVLEYNPVDLTRDSIKAVNWDGDMCQAMLYNENADKYGKPDNYYYVKDTSGRKGGPGYPNTSEGDGYKIITTYRNANKHKAYSGYIRYAYRENISYYYSEYSYYFKYVDNFVYSEHPEYKGDIYSVKFTKGIPGNIPDKDLVCCYEKNPDKDYVTVTGKGTHKNVPEVVSTTHTYTLKYVGAGKGTYTFKPYNYEQSSKINSSEYLYSDGYTAQFTSRQNDNQLKILKGYKQDVNVYVKYKSGKKYTNKDLFKKFGIGLAYKGNDISKGEEVTAYRFLGWYTDSKGVNLFDKDKRVTSDTTLYAKWLEVYPTDELRESNGEVVKSENSYNPTYNVSFNKGTADANEQVVDMPETITYIRNGDSLVMPNKIPKRVGYIFSGWYLNGKLYDFNSPVKGSFTLTAGWSASNKNNYVIKFNPNPRNSTDVVENMPADVADYKANGMRADLTSGEPTEPTLANYTFGGWYRNKACTREFKFGEALDANLSKLETINVYAKWIPNGAAAPKLILNGNAPAGAEAEVNINNKNDIVASQSGRFDTVNLQAPALAGNLETKLNKYNVKVVTIAASDFDKSQNKYADDNKKLIQNCDLIVVNEKINDSLQEVFKKSDGKYVRQELFGDRITKTSYTTKAYKYTKFGGKLSGNGYIDLDWDTAYEIFKVSAVGGKGDGEDVVPVIYDYSILNDPALYKNETSELNSFNKMKYMTSENKEVSLRYDGPYESTDKLSSANIYKLYLMLEQMKPATIYNAYLSVDDKGKSNNKSSCRIINSGDKKGYFETKVKDKTYQTNIWSNKTLVPVEAMSGDDFSNYSKNHAASCVAQVIGFNDAPYYSEDTISNRSLVMATGNSMLSQLFSEYPVVPDENMKGYMESVGQKGNGAGRFASVDALYYLIHSEKNSTNFESDINVLELEPTGADAAFKNSVFWFWYVSKYVDNFTGNVTVTKKSTWEIVGDIDDFNSKYDVIYFGTSLTGISDKMKSTLQTTADNKTVVYSHLGKIVALPDKNAGTQDDYAAGDNYSKPKYNKTVYDAKTRKSVFSGNDITGVNYNKLLDFAKAGYPIVFGRGFLLKTTPITGEIEHFDNEEDDHSDFRINTEMIDKSSYIYKLVTTMKTPLYKDSCFFENQYNAKNAKSFLEALSTKKFSLTMKETPVEYNEGASDANKYINGQNLDAKNMNFKFKINGSDQTTYTVKLFIDTNADGKFNKEEQLDSLEVTDLTANTSVRYSNLVGGHDFKVSRVIEDYVGALQWKLEISDNSEATGGLVRCSETGICAIKAAQKTELHVLQIAPVKGSQETTKNSVYFPTDEEINRARAARGTDINASNMDQYFDNIIHPINDSTGSSKDTSNNCIGKEYYSISGKFYYYLSNVDNFDVHFTRISTREFEQRCSKNYNNSHPNEPKLSDYMKQFNMLILGFSDCYADINSDACEAIDTFINDGKTVLFTHDTTSNINIDGVDLYNREYHSKSENGNVWQYWGYNINQYFRKILGQDRYDVTTNKGNYEKIEKSQTHDYVYKQGYVQDSKNYSHLEHDDKDKLLNQGFTNVCVMENLGNYTTTTVNQCNYGQITKYPYQIKESFSVTTTHSQYYQLDLEDDDTVVWYSLQKPGDNNSYYSEKNDVRNNYYIYNKGNITYSGVGHNCANMGNDEVKLFVNTIIAAYRATVQPTVPVITNADKSTNNKDSDYVYVDYDATANQSKGDSKPFGEGVFNQSVKTTSALVSGGFDSITKEKNATTKRVFFTLKNNSIVMNKTMTVHFYPAIYDSAGTFTPLTNYALPLRVYRVDNEIEKKNKSGGKLMTYSQPFNIKTRIINDTITDDSITQNIFGPILESNDEYYVDIPIEDDYYTNVVYTGKDGERKIFKALDNENDFAIQIQVVMRYGKNQKSNEPLRGKRNVLLMRRGMFSLD